MICLGIESTAHTFGCGIVDGTGKILSNVRDIFVTEKGGINPADAREHHLKVKDTIVKEALKKSKLKITDVDLIAFSQGPGLAPSLLVGRNKAVEISKENKIPIVGVNHCIAHLEIGKLKTRAKDPVLLYVSGANTQIIAYYSGKYRIFGETLDQGIGNFIDAFARYIGLGFPGGPKIENLAAKGKNYIEVPYVAKGMDVSFSGILTNLKSKHDSKKYQVEDLCLSLQETVFSMMVEVAERAMAHCGKNELVLGGGVACNNRLQEMCRIMCRERGAKFFAPGREFLLDNGAMTAWLGILQKRESSRNQNIDIKPYQRTDEVHVNWQ
jgi:N6-L-threonylcarbamoyladenine synthase